MVQDWSIVKLWPITYWLKWRIEKKSFEHFEISSSIYLCKNHLNEFEQQCFFTWSNYFGNLDIYIKLDVNFVIKQLTFAIRISIVVRSTLFTFGTTKKSRTTFQTLGTLKSFRLALTFTRAAAIHLTITIYYIYTIGVTWTI